MALQHAPSNVFINLYPLLNHIIKCAGLVLVLLAGIAVAAVDHQSKVDASISSFVLSLSYCAVVEVGPILTSSQDDVNVGIAGGADDCCPSFGVHAKESVRALCGHCGVDCHLDIAVCAVLEADGHAQAAGHLPVSLALCCAGYDGSPTEKVGQVLWHDQV